MTMVPEVNSVDATTSCPDETLAMPHIDFADPMTNADPFAIFTALRERDPVHWSEPMKAWIITRYDDVKAVSLNNAEVTADRLAPFFASLPEGRRAGFANLMTYLGTMIIPRTRINTTQNAPEGRLIYLQRVNSEHESIYNAIRNQDSEAARAAMRTHLSNSRERLRKGKQMHTTPPEPGAPPTRTSVVAKSPPVV